MTRLLIIDDSPEDRELLTDLVQTDDIMTVSAFATGREGLDAIRQMRPDCVLLDYRLEAEDGIDVLAKIKEQVPFCPVIMLSGQGNENVAATSIKLGAADYLVKQRLTETYLHKAIQNAISRSALEEKVADQEQQLRQFLSILVHDLRAPLRNIKVLGELAVEAFSAGHLEKTKGLLTDQSNVAMRADALISTLERYALLELDVEVDAVSLAEAAQAAKENLATEIFDRNAKVEIGSLPMVRGHMPQLVQLFQNLIGNGLKYNESDCPKILIEAEDSDEKSITVQVADNGIGIPDIYQTKIFEPLKRLWNSREYDGTGLGLAICQKIVERHDGNIWCASVEGKGSQFYLRFPLLPVD